MTHVSYIDKLFPAPRDGKDGESVTLYSIECSRRCPNVTRAAATVAVTAYSKTSNAARARLSLGSAVSFHIASSSGGADTVSTSNPLYVTIPKGSTTPVEVSLVGQSELAALTIEPTVDGADGKDAGRNLFVWKRAKLYKNVPDGGDDSFSTDAVSGAPTAYMNVTFPSTAANNGVFFQQWGTLQAGSVYTVSIWAKASAAATVTYAPMEGQDNGNWRSWPLTTAWRRLWYTFTARDATPTLCLYPAGSSAVTVCLCGIKVEEGDAMTAFCLNEEDLKGEDGQDGTSFKISGNAVGYFNDTGLVVVGETALPVDTYFSGLGYTPKAGDLCLEQHYTKGASILKYASGAWADSGLTPAEGDCWLVDNEKETSCDGHVFAYVPAAASSPRVVATTKWKDMGNLKGPQGPEGPQGPDGEDADYYMQHSPTEAAIGCDANGNPKTASWTFSLWHKKGSEAAEQVTGSQLSWYCPADVTGTNRATADTITVTPSKGDKETALAIIASISGNQVASLSLPRVCDGSVGDTGPEGKEGVVMRKTEWAEGVEYHNDRSLATFPRYLDIVLIETGGKYYAWQCLKTHTSTTANKPTAGAGAQDYWLQMDDPGPVYTPLLVAEKALVDFFQTHDVILTGNLQNVVKAVDPQTAMVVNPETAGFWRFRTSGDPDGGAYARSVNRSLAILPLYEAYKGTNIETNAFQRAGVRVSVQNEYNHYAENWDIMPRLMAAAYARGGASADCLASQALAGVHGAVLVVCADPRLLDLSNCDATKAAGERVAVKATTYSDDMQGMFVCNGRLGKLLLLMPGETVELQTYVKDGALYWVVLNGSEFQAVAKTLDILYDEGGDTLTGGDFRWYQDTGSGAFWGEAGKLYLFANPSIDAKANDIVDGVQTTRAVSSKYHPEIRVCLPYDLNTDRLHVEVVPQYLPDGIT